MSEWKWIYVGSGNCRESGIRSGFQFRTGVVRKSVSGGGDKMGEGREWEWRERRSEHNQLGKEERDKDDNGNDDDRDSDHDDDDTVWCGGSHCDQGGDDGRIFGGDQASVCARYGGGRTCHVRRAGGWA